MSMNEPGAGAGAPAAGSPPVDGSGGTAGSPPAGGSAASPAAPAAQPIDQLRQAYETTKTELARWKALNADPEAVGKSHQSFSKITEEASTLGGKHGYQAEEIAEAMAKDPVGTLNFLRRKEAEARGSDRPLTRQEAEQIADRRAQDALRPFQQERETRMDHEAEQRYDGEFDRQFKTSFPKGLPDSCKEALQGLAWSLVTENKDGFGALRAKGDLSTVAPAFESAKKTLLKILADYGEYEKANSGGTPPREGAPAPNGKKGRTLGQIAADMMDEDVPWESAIGRK